jgi:hypothetical protein
VAWDDLLHVPDRRFFRRKGEPAFEMIGVDGEEFTDADAYARYLSRHLPEAYMTTRDLRNYLDVLRKVVAGELGQAEGIKAMPKLKRVGGTCPCSRSVRWVMDDSAADKATLAT